jgi:GMP synthase (glutamine-hydrolysing)
VQFHPEVSHTDEGLRLLGNFLDLCGARRTWQVTSMIETCAAQVTATAPAGQIICGLSGGVDSSITAKLIARAAPGRLTCIFVDNGLLRLGEVEQVKQTFADPEFNLRTVDASGIFLERLRGVTDPQQKRAIIGHAFIDVFYAEAQRITGARFLAQGTLYPDVIESVAAHGGPTDCIKLHHNVGGLPADIAEKFTLIEPLRMLFKDEVRRMGLEFGLPEDIVWRHPFPGPGLAVRIVGEIRPERLEMLRRADAIFMHELKEAGLYQKIGQAFVVFLPVQSVGVMGDERSYENVVVLRSVDTTDFMTADWTRLPYDFLQKVAGRIISEVRGINRVVFDVTSKPPGTIEWE